MRVGILGTQARDLVNFRGHLASELARRGHEVFGIAPDWTPALTEDLGRLGAASVSIPMDRTGMNPFRELVHLAALHRRLQVLHLDALLAYELKSATFGVLAAWAAGVPRRFAMITGRGTTLQGAPQGAREHLVRTVVRRLYTLSLRRTQGVLFQNGDDAAFFRDLGMLPDAVPRRIIAGSGVDLTHFNARPLPEGKTVFLFVGRLLRNKGIQEFVEAARLLKGRGVPFEARILGGLDPNPNGIRAAQLEAWVREGVVAHLGEVRDVRPALEAAHVLVLPSYGEGTPRSVLEAMAMGRAIITTDAPGCRETIQDGLNGLQVPVADPPALAAAMQRLAEDRDLVHRFGQACRTRAERTYDVRSVTADILTFMGLERVPDPAGPSVVSG